MTFVITISLLLLFLNSSFILSCFLFKFVTVIVKGVTARRRRLRTNRTTQNRGTASRRDTCALKWLFHEMPFLQTAVSRNGRFLKWLFPEMAVSWNGVFWNGVSWNGCFLKWLFPEMVFPEMFFPELVFPEISSARHNPLPKADSPDASKCANEDWDSGRLRAVAFFLSFISFLLLIITKFLWCSFSLL